MNIGSIGVLLAQKLFASIDMPEGRTHLADGTRVADWWFGSTADGYNNSRNCITDYYVRELKALNYSVEGMSIAVQLAGEPFSPITLRHIGALRLSYNTLKKMDVSKSWRMPGTDLTSEQSFFLAYAQTQCYRRQELTQLIRTQLGSYDERTALNTAFIHMPEFTQAFQCQARERKCFWSIKSYLFSMIDPHHHIGTILKVSHESQFCFSTKENRLRAVCNSFEFFSKLLAVTKHRFLHAR